ncbi:MAG: riboflavin biosynthesis protein RibF [Clostridia bacterium]|nr:riboflavin biosynthesis protein RibF [Clostridia bacterium]
MQKYAIALGMFDGVHKGHKAVLMGAINSGYKSVAVTFSSIPFKKGGVLNSAKEKKQKLLNFGIDEVLFLEFSEVCNLSPEEFLNYLAKKYNVAKICCGFNYRFGKMAAGDTAFLKEWCTAKNIEFFECPEVLYGEQTVSSTYIKGLLLNGDLETANLLLEDGFSITAKVQKGDARGRTWGFPTINQRYPETKAPVKRGVYHTVVTIDGKTYNAVTNIGVRPTYETEYVSAESYVLDYDGNAYDKEVETKLVSFLREEKKFSSKEELIKAIGNDAEYVKKHS